MRLSPSFNRVYRTRRPGSFASNLPNGNRLNGDGGYGH